MPRPLTDRRRSILRGILRDLEDLASRTPQYIPGDYKCVTERDAIEAAKDGFVAGSPGRWLGLHMTPSLYVMVSRDYVALERDGLLVRRAFGYDGSRTSHLGLTEAGEEIARKLIEGEVPYLPNSTWTAAHSAGEPGELSDGRTRDA